MDGRGGEMSVVVTRKLGMGASRGFLPAQSLVLLMRRTLQAVGPIPLL